MYARSGLHRPPSVRRSSKAELRLNLYVKPLYEEVTKLLYTTLLASAYTTGLRRVAGRNGGVEPEGTCLLVQKSLYLLYWYKSTNTDAVRPQMEFSGCSANSVMHVQVLGLLVLLVQRYKY